jgi:hypothetical protein
MIFALACFEGDAATNSLFNPTNERQTSLCGIGGGNAN